MIHMIQKIKNSLVTIVYRGMVIVSIVVGLYMLYRVIPVQSVTYNLPYPLASSDYKHGEKIEYIYNICYKAERPLVVTSFVFKGEISGTQLDVSVPYTINAETQEGCSNRPYKLPIGIPETLPCGSTVYAQTNFKLLYPFWKEDKHTVYTEKFNLICD